jgi:hypothetical protein
LEDTDALIRSFSEGFDLGVSMTEASVDFHERWVRDQDLSESAARMASDKPASEIAAQYLTLCMYHNMLLKETVRLCTENARLRTSSGEGVIDSVILDILEVQESMRDE